MDEAKIGAVQAAMDGCGDDENERGWVSLADWRRVGKSGAARYLGVHGRVTVIPQSSDIVN